MKQILSAIAIIVLIVSLVVISFTIQQANDEQKNLTLDLQHRSSTLADNLKTSIEPYSNGDSNDYLQTLVDKSADKERLIGLAVFDNKDNILAISSDLSKELTVSSQLFVATVMDSDNADGEFLSPKDSQKVYVFAVPLHTTDQTTGKESVSGSLLLMQNAGYIDTAVIEIWKNNMIRLLVQAILLAGAILLIIRWLIYQPIFNLVQAMRNARSGLENGKTKLGNHFFFQPLINEVTNISKSLTEARTIASQEARLRIQKLDSPWTSQRLKEFTKDVLKGRNIVVVSNREPYMHEKHGGRITYLQPASGMVTAIEPIMRACEGLWIAHGSGNADKLVVDKDDKVNVPPDEPKYTLKRVWLTKEEEKGYYEGFSNEGIWPLCHTAHTRPVFRKEDWEEYQKVNGKFAQTVLKEIKNMHKPIVLIQDYHFALLPRMIKNARPDAMVGIFWHIPWPHAEGFKICPWRKEILDGMLGADLIGFHTQLHCNNFIDTVGHELEALIDLETFAVQKGGHVSYIKPFPISIPFLEETSSLTDDDFDKKEFLKDMGISSEFVGVGVDRLDYTKGIPERLLGIEYFLDQYPQYKEKFTFIQIAAPSRTSISEYSQFGEKVEKEVERINNKFKIKHWKPILYIKKHHTHEEITKLYKAADVCLVTSLHDGMNLVAKEFIMARSDENGVLILSQFAGASGELKDAIIVNPYNTEQVGEAVRQSLEMMQSEKMKRMKKLRDIVKNYNVYRWSADLLKEMVNLE